MACGGCNKPRSGTMRSNIRINKLDNQERTKVKSIKYKKSGSKPGRLRIRTLQPR